jgi:hypothetical protein
MVSACTWNIFVKEFISNIVKPALVTTFIKLQSNLL